MKPTCLIWGLLLAATLPALSQTKTVEATEADSSIVLLDRSVSGRRNPVALKAGERPGQIVVRYGDDQADDWTEVRWVFRFPLHDLIGPVKHAQLVLWAMSKDKTDVIPKLELIQGAQDETIKPQDRVAEPIGNPVDVIFPKHAGPLEIDVTEQVNLALAQKMNYAAFRMKAETDDSKPADGEKARFNFGGPINVWKWPQSEPPCLQLEP